MFELEYQAVEPASFDQQSQRSKDCASKERDDQSRAVPLLLLLCSDVLWRHFPTTALKQEQSWSLSEVLPAQVLAATCHLLEGCCLKDLLRAMMSMDLQGLSLA